MLMWLRMDDPQRLYRRSQCLPCRTRVSNKLKPDFWKDLPSYAAGSMLEKLLCSRGANEVRST